jgi:4-hydroxymandelate oxidase
MREIEYFQKIAKEKLPQATYDYYAGWACDGISLLQNRNAFDRCQITPRVLKPVSKIDTSIKIFGTNASIPIIVAPTSFHQLANSKGEIATANGAKRADAIMIGSLLSNKSLEDISSTGANLWFQIYVLNDREFTKDLIHRIEAANYKALVVTVDSHVLGIRYNKKNSFRLPKKYSLPNFKGMKSFQEQFNNVDLFYKNLSWKDIEWIRSITKIPIILKGILHPEDAKIAANNFIDGIVISNHGGRQLDTAVAPFNILPKIADIVNGRTKIFIDGSVRRGTDVVKALCMGADAVLVGRPILWGLAAKGELGVLEVLNTLKHELNVAMALSGFSSLKELALSGSEIILN